MTQMKAYTGVEQSKKLAEILPLESADMWWAERYEGRVLENGQYVVNDTPYYYLSIIQPSSNNNSQDTIKDIPCWSLAALLDLMPRIEHVKPFVDLSPKLDSEKVAIYYHSGDSPYIVKDNLIDACYEMIIELNKRKLL